MTMQTLIVNFENANIIAQGQMDDEHTKLIMVGRKEELKVLMDNMIKALHMNPDSLDIFPLTVTSDYEESIIRTSYRIDENTKWYALRRSRLIGDDF